MYEVGACDLHQNLASPIDQDADAYTEAQMTVACGRQRMDQPCGPPEL